MVVDTRGHRDGGGGAGVVFTLLSSQIRLIQYTFASQVY